MSTTRPTLATERLILRPWREADLAPFAAMNADPRVMAHMPALLTPAESNAMVRRIDAHFDRHGFGLWAVEVAARSPAPCIGFVGLAVPGFEAPFTPCVEIGWRLAAAEWHKGYATEAARAVLAFGFGPAGLGEIVSFTVPENTRSLAVMARLGMRPDPDGAFDHPGLPAGHRLRRHVLYRLSRERWQAAAGTARL